MHRKTLREAAAAPMASAFFAAVCGAPPPTTSTEPLARWSVGDVSGWLQELELQEHVAAFTKASVDGESLAKLTEADLIEHLGFGDNKLAARKLLERRDKLARFPPPPEVESLTAKLAEAMAQVKALKSGAVASSTQAEAPSSSGKESGGTTQSEQIALLAPAAASSVCTTDLPDVQPAAVVLVHKETEAHTQALGPLAQDGAATLPALAIAAPREEPPALDVGVAPAAPASDSAGVVHAPAEEVQASNPPAAPEPADSPTFLDSLVNAASSAIADLAAALVGNGCYNPEPSSAATDASSSPAPAVAAPVPTTSAVQETAAPAPAAPAPVAGPAAAVPAPVSNIAMLAARAHALAAAAEKALAAAQLEALKGGSTGGRRGTPDGQNALSRVLKLQAALAQAVGAAPTPFAELGSQLAAISEDAAAEAPRAVAPMGTLRLVSGGSEGLVRLLKLGGEVKTNLLEGHTAAVRCLVALPVAQGSASVRFVSGSVDKSLRIWRAVDGSCERILRAHTGTVRCLAALSSSSCVSASDDATLCVWGGLDGPDEPTCTVLRGHTAAVWAVCRLARDGPADVVAFVSAGWDHTLRLWLDGKCERVCTGHGDNVNVLAALPDGRCASGSADRSIRIWAPLESESAMRVLLGHTNAVYALVCFADGRLVSGGGDETLRVWEDGSCVRVMKGHSGTVSSLADAGAGRVLSASSDRMLCMWRYADGVCERQVGGSDGPIWAVACLSQL